MTDEDVLVRAARALREAHSGERQGSGFTRARVMNTVHRQRRRRVLRWAVFSPIASLLLVGSAWAQSTGKWPVIWKAVTSVLVAERSNEEDGRGQTGQPSPRPRHDAPQDVLAPPSPSDESEPMDEPTVPPEAPGPPEPSAAVPAPSVGAAASPARRPIRGRPSSRRRAAPASHPNEAGAGAPAQNEAPAATEPARDRELSRFRAAHDLHFAGNRPREALEAYAEYLREFPNGRFVPEARYNGALDQIKLGNESAAREALEPFSAGRFGGYRQKEARELLEALDRQRSPHER